MASALFRIELNQLGRKVFAGLIRFDGQVLLYLSDGLFPDHPKPCNAFIGCRAHHSQCEACRDRAQLLICLIKYSGYIR